MKASRQTKTEFARRAWHLMFDFLIFTTPARERSLQRRGMTPNDSRALFSLEQEQGRPIGALASQWGCDPSNATFIIDRLEKAGLAERRASPGDRRVKLIMLTERGARTKMELLDEFHIPPAELDELSSTELEALERIFRKLQPEKKQEDAQNGRARLATTATRLDAKPRFSKSATTRRPNLQRNPSGARRGPSKG